MNYFVTLTFIVILSFFSKAYNQEVTPMRIVCYRNGLDTYNSSTYFTANDDVGELQQNFSTSNENCTHVILKAGVLDRVTAYVTHNMSSAKTYKKHFPYLKLILHLDPEIDEIYGYPQVIESKVGRSRLISSAVSLLKDNEYDGLDVVFHEKYISEMRLLLLDMRKEFNKHDLMLTALFPSRWNLQKNISDIAESLDFINIRSFEETKISRITELSAPLFYSNFGNSSNSTWSVDKLINTYLDLGVPRSKIVMGILTYAVTHELDDADLYYVGSPSERMGDRGKYAWERGFLTLNEITGPGWVYHRDNDSQAPYASNYLLWASYDDDVSVTAKADYIVDYDLGGAMLSTFYDYDEIDSELPFVKILRQILMGE